MSSQFTTIIEGLNRGRVAVDIDEQLMEVAKGVEETGNPGEVTIKLKITKSQHGELVIGSDVNGKIPKAKVPANIFFFDTDKQCLTRDDPRQRELPMPTPDTQTA